MNTNKTTTDETKTDGAKERAVKILSGEDSSKPAGDEVEETPTEGEEPQETVAEKNERIEKLEAEVEKWKKFSRTWEERAKHQQESGEQADNQPPADNSETLTKEDVAALLAEERSKIQKEYALELVKTHFASSATAAGVDASKIEKVLNFDAFITDENKADIEAVDELLEFITSTNAEVAQKNSTPSWGLTTGAKREPAKKTSRGLGQYGAI